MVTIKTYSQYFTITSTNFSKLLHTLHAFNEELLTHKMALIKVPGQQTPKVVIKPDKRFYIVENADVSNPNKKDIVRYPITLVEKMLEYLISNGVDSERITVTHNDHMVGRDIVLNLNPNYTPRDYQEVYINRISKLDKHNVLIDLITGGGKSLSCSTPIRVKHGWKLIGDIRRGEKVIGRDGLETTVTGVYPQGVKQLYKVTFSDGRSVEACKEHLWAVYSHNFARIDERIGAKILSTENIINHLESKSGTGEITSGYYIDLPTPSEFPSSCLRIQPYALGVMLGSRYRHGLSVINVVKHVFDRFNKSLNPGQVDFKTFGINNPDLHEELKNISLYTTKSWDESIPEIYLEGSLEQRYELLRGLMDTDGEVCKEGIISYTTASRQLARDVQLLVRSLGGICSINNEYTRTHNNMMGGDKLLYRLSIHMKKPKDIVTLPKHLEMLRGTNNPNLKLRIVSIEKSIKADAVCISVDNKDKLYVVKDYIVTHNTFISMASMVNIKKAFSMIVLPRYIDKWIGDITTLTDIQMSEILVIKGLTNLTDVLNGKVDTSLYKCFIISLTTMGYLTKKHLSNELVEYTDKSPTQLFEVLGTEIVLNDETHQEFANVYKTMLFANIKMFIGITATLVTKDEETDRMYHIMLPEENRISNIVKLDPYIYISSVRFRFRNRNRIKFKNHFGYNQAIFENSIIKDTQTLNGYLKMIYGLINNFYIKKRNEGDKVIIFFGTVRLCEIMLGYLRRHNMGLKLTKYTEEDDYDVIDNADIIASTPASLGTAIDVKNLVTVIQTVNVDSTAANLQVLGRLRDIKGKKMDFIYTWSSDIKQHKRYNFNRTKLFVKKAKNIRAVEYREMV